MLTDIFTHETYLIYMYYFNEISCIVLRLIRNDTSITYIT